MHILIDIVALIVLLFFLWSGWRKGLLLSLLSVVRVVLAYGVAYFAGRYIGFWLGEIANRPRIVTIPLVAGLTFVIITFLFHVLMSNIRDDRRDKEKKENYQHPWYLCLGGAGVNFFVGLFSLMFLFWLGDVFMVGMTGRGIPGADQAKLAEFARRGVYECVNVIVSRDGCETQAAAMSRVISRPAEGMRHLENIISADSIQSLIKDNEFAKDLMSGDAARIEQNAALQRLFADEKTLGYIKKLGLLSGRENKSELYARLSKVGSNETIQASVESLRSRELFSTDKIPLLIRDPEFDVILGELLK